MTSSRQRAYLRGVREDSLLRQEVAALLAAHARADRFLEGPPPLGWHSRSRHSHSRSQHSHSRSQRSRSHPRSQRLDLAGPSRAGQRIGPYEVLRQIGGGGTSRVYLATRFDGADRRQVALKVFRRRLRDPHLVRRFRSGRQVLARLRHPCVVALLDGGTTRGGVPYFVMELARGDTLIDYCERRRLSLVPRLALFLKVCDAVDVMHRHLLVHRDIQPANILVAGGLPKLVGFRIAELRGDGGIRMAPAETTRAPMRPAAPASPERTGSGSMTSAADIYALGIVLLQLLSGVDPLPLASSLVADRSGCPRSFGPEGIDRRRLHGLSSGGLGHILAKALHWNRRYRYTSVARFSEDIHRYLHGVPPSAPLR